MKTAYDQIQRAIPDLDARSVIHLDVATFCSLVDDCLTDMDKQRLVESIIEQLRSDS